MVGRLPGYTPAIEFPLGMAVGMAIFRCNKCGLVQEQPDSLAGTRWPCGRCGQTGSIHNTVAFVERLVAMYLDARREPGRSAAQPVTRDGGPLPIPSGEAAPEDVDVLNTDHFASERQHGPIVDWFRRRQIRVDANLRGVDTTGFFDEVAVSIGADYALFGEVLDRIRWAQQKGFATAKIALSRKPDAEAGAISAFCQQLYDYSFVGKCFRNAQDNSIRLVVQTAPAIRQFFAGEWLEWFALVTCLSYAKDERRRFSCARKLQITFADDARHEIDVFMLFDGKQPICIECKTGEFRQDIDRCIALRKRLGLTGGRFAVCVAGLDEGIAAGLSATHDLTFMSERRLAAWLRETLAPGADQRRK